MISFPINTDSLKNNFISRNLNFILVVAVSIFVAVNFLNLTTFLMFFPKEVRIQHKVLNIFRDLFIVIYLYSLIFSKERIKDFIKFLLFIAVVLVYKKISNSYLLFDLLFVPLFLAKLIDRDLLFKCLFVISLTCLATTMLLSYLDIFHDLQFFRGNVKRYSLGFVHPNSLGFAVCWISFLFGLMKKTTNLIDVIFLVSAVLFCYFVPNSITPAFIIMLLLSAKISVSLLDRTCRFKSINFKTVANVTIVLIVFILLLNYFIAYTGTFKDFLVKMPGSIWARFELGNMAFERYGLSFFGTPIDSVTEYHEQILGTTKTYFTVDSAYFFLPINYGIVFFTIFITTFLYILRKSIISKALTLSVIFILLALYSVSESIVVAPIMMPLYAYIFCKNECK